MRAAAVGERRTRRPALWMGALLAALTAGCGDSTGPARGPGLHVLSSFTRSDTALAWVANPLVVEVRDSTGRPRPGVTIRFQMVARTKGVYATSDTAGVPNFPHLDTTDAAGRVAAYVRLGTAAGTARLAIEVRSLGYADTLDFTVMPGRAASVILSPADTAVYTNATYAVRARTQDSYHNPRDDVVQLAAGSPGVSVQGSVVRATTPLGREFVVGTYQGIADTAWLSVVPQAWVATQQYDPVNGGPIGLFLMQLDGSGRQQLAPGLINSFPQQGFEWSPDGQQLALVRDHDVNLLTPGGEERLLAEMSGEIVTAARFSRDGRWVYFAHAGSATQPEGLYRVGVDGTGLQHLGQAGMDYFAAPSHDGQSVAYVSLRSACLVEPCIRVLDLATNRDRTYGTQDFLARGGHVAWSPTEDLIAYKSGGRLMLVRSDGTQARVLAEDVSHVEWMDWSPDGRWLLVAENGVMLIDVQSGLRLPLGQFLSSGATAWRP